MIELENVSYRYPESDECALQNVSFTVSPGECVALVGLNASGKSTLTRLLNASRIPDGGRVMVDGIDATAGERARRAIAQSVGLVRQDPRDQLVASRVFEEVAFGPCNLGLSQSEVKRRVKHAIDVCGLQHKSYANCEELSGGEQQRLATAGVLAMEPRYLVFDEVTAFLDTTARRDLVCLMHELTMQGHGVVVASHEIADMLYADRICLLEAGRLAWQGSLSDMLTRSEILERAGLDTDPLAAELAHCAALGIEPQAIAQQWAAEKKRAGHTTDKRAGHTTDPVDLTTRAAELGVHSTGSSGVYAAESGVHAAGLPSPHSTGLELTDVSLAYDSEPVLSHVSLWAEPGCITLLAGSSGAGKSTALRIMAGVLPPDSGVASLNGNHVELGAVGLAFQCPEEQLFCTSVYEEVAFGPMHQGLKGQELAQKVEYAMSMLHIENMAQASPFTLSGGQARRVALAAVVAMPADAYVFDEPTAGLDGIGTRELQALLEQLARDGSAVVVVSHDICTWLDLVQKVYLIDAGRMVWQGTPQALRDDVGIFEQAGMTVPLPLMLAAQGASK